VNDRLRILEMVKEGKVTPEEAARLLDELDRTPRAAARTLRVRIRRAGGQHVQFTVPVSVAGTVLSLIPEATRAKLGQQGVNLTELVRAVQDGDAFGEIVNIREPGGNLIEVTVE
jgi:transposase-like protein